MDTEPLDLWAASRAAERAERDRSEGVVRRCPTCCQHFSGDAAQFCPFDGDPLEVATTYRADANPLLGTAIDGRYEVEEVLGEGGMGSVYRVRHCALDKRFALKVMRADLAREGELAARFIQEARAAAAVIHVNIVQITDFGALPGGAPYFVMELLEGMSLSKLIRKGGPLPVGQGIRILSQVAAGLGAAHAAGVIHRDLKPDNVHVASDGSIKILDFGVAKMAGAGRLTRRGMIFGTPHYMSPEQASGGAVDARADIYALGIIMYEMFTGRVPFEADSYMGVLTKHMFMDPEPPSSVHQAARDLGALESVILRCLEKKPELRFESMEAFAAELSSIVRFTGERVEIAGASAPSRRPRPSFDLADELEPPERAEVATGSASRARSDWARVALVGAGIAIASGAGAYTLVRQSVVPPAASAPAAASPLAAEPAARGGIEPEPAAPPLPVHFDPQPLAADPLAQDPPPAERYPPRRSEPAMGARPKEPPASPGSAPSQRREKGDKGAAASGARAKRDRPGPRPTPEPAFGSGEIVNPWPP